MVEQHSEKFNVESYVLTQVELNGLSGDTYADIIELNEDSSDVLYAALAYYYSISASYYCYWGQYRYDDMISWIDGGIMKVGYEKMNRLED